MVGIGIDVPEDEMENGLGKHKIYDDYIVCGRMISPRVVMSY